MRKIKLLLLIFFLEVIALMVFAQNQHRIRAVIYKVIETDDRKDFTWRPKEAPSWYKVDPPQLYKDFISEPQEMISNISSEFQQYVALMNYTRNLCTNKGTDVEIIADDVYEIREILKNGFETGCAPYAWLFLAYLRSIDRDVRVIGLEYNDGLGASGHAVNEVWVKKLQKWVLFDVYNNVFFTFDDMPLSTLEMRDKIYQGKSDLIQVYQGDIQGDIFAIPKAKIINYYADKTIQDIVLVGKGNLIYSYEHRYGILQILAPIFDKLPRRIWRVLENIFGQGDLRVHFIDDYSTPYHLLLYRTIFRLLILSVFITLCMIIWQVYQKLQNSKKTKIERLF